MFRFDRDQRWNLNMRSKRACLYFKLAVLGQKTPNFLGDHDPSESAWCSAWGLEQGLRGMNQKR